jgi:hypothetical protein
MLLRNSVFDIRHSIYILAQVFVFEFVIAVPMLLTNIEINSWLSFKAIVNFSLVGPT